MLNDMFLDTALSFKKALFFRKACYFIAGGCLNDDGVSVFISLIFSKISGIKIWSSGQIFVTL